MDNKNAYVGLIISDIHVGAIDPDILFEELYDQFISYIHTLSILDFIVISGDLFDTRISLNSPHAKMLFIFMERLCGLCKVRDIKLRIIKGTESHDNKQLEVLKHIDNDLDMKIISTVEEEDLFPDMKVLYVPEEYVKSVEEYYKDYFIKDRYDMVFGHGMITDVAHYAKKQESEITMSKAPIFETKALLDICKGPIFFGHTHKHQKIRDRFFYVGSFTRWVFGEEEPKGFMCVAYTPSTNLFKSEFVENKLAKDYFTIDINYDNPIYCKDLTKIDNILEFIDGLYLDLYRVRIVFHVPEIYENTKLLTELLHESLSKYSNVKVVVKQTALNKQREEVDNKVKQLLGKYDFVFDNGITIEEKLSKFIQVRYNEVIEPEIVRKYLFDKINS